MSRNIRLEIDGQRRYWLEVDPRQKNTFPVPTN